MYHEAETSLPVSHASDVLIALKDTQELWDRPYGEWRLGHHVAMLSLGKAALDVVLPDNKEGLGEKLTRETTIARQQLEDLDERQVQSMNLAFVMGSESPWLSTVLRSAAALPVEALIAKDGEGSYKLSDETVQNYFQQHIHASSEQQRKLDEKVEMYIDQYTQRVNYAVNSGWLPSIVQDRARQLYDLTILADDGYMSTLIGGRGLYTSAEAYKESQGILSLAPLGIDDEHVITHELTHGLSDRSKKSRTSGIYSLFGTGEAGRAMNEAITEHISLSLIHGRLLEADPIHVIRRTGGGAYMDERTFLARLSENGVRPVDITEFIGAYFETKYERDCLGDASATARLERSLQEAFPACDVTGVLKDVVDVAEYEKVAAQVTASARAYEKKHPLKSMATKLRQRKSR